MIQIRLVLFICMVGLLTNASFAQKREQKQLDSLLTLLPAAKEDTTKVELLIRISQSYIPFNQDQSFDYAKKALQLAEKIHADHLLSFCCFYLGNKYLQIDSNAKGLQYLQQSLAIEKKGGDVEAIASVMTNISNVYELQSNYPLALEYAFDALKLFEKNGNKNGQANGWCNIANIYTEQGEWDNAIKNYNKALALYKAINNDEGIALIEGNIGNIYLEQQNYRKALEYYNTSLEKYKKIGDPSGIDRNTANIGNVFLKQKKYTEALSKYQEALGIALPNQLTDAAGYDYAGISEAYLSMATEKDAMAQIPNGETKNTLLSKAKKYSDSAVYLLEQLGDVSALANARRVQSKTLYELGDYKSAYVAYEAYKTLNDSIYNVENNKKLTQKGMQYEFDKKEAASRAEKEKLKNIRNSIAIGLVGTLIFLIVVYRQRNRIAKEKHRSEELLLNILPEEVAEELKAKGSADAKLIDEVTVLFTDFKGFTALSEKMSPKELVQDLHECFTAFDHIIQKYGLEKIKTIGDSYMAAGGLPTPTTTHAQDVVHAALEIRKYMETTKEARIKDNLPYFEIRIGVHTGPVVAGIVGVKKFAYDIWGDTVNIASRMESSGVAGKVNISGSTYQLIKDNFKCEYRGKIEAKSKGMVDMYFVEE